MKTSIYSLLIIFVGFCAYFNVLKSPFYLDDIGQIVNNQNIQQLKNIPSYYFQTFHLLQNNNFTIGHIYRPLFYTFYAFLYSAGEGKPFIFHFVQILIFCLNAVLLFLIFTKFYGQKLAFMISLIFLVHPANEEVAQYIADLQDVLFFFFGALSLFIITTNKAQKTSSTIIASILLLLAFLSKETGVLFLFLILLYIFIFKKILLKQYLFSFSIVSTIYIILRFIAANNTSNVISNIHLSIPLQERLLIVPKIIYYYFREIALPTLTTPSTNYFLDKNPNSIILPVMVITVVLALLTVTGYLIRKFFNPQFPLFVFVSNWALIGFSFHSHLLPLDVIVAPRWMYFSLAGVLGIVGVICVVLKPYLLKYKKILFVFYILFIMIYIASTLKLNMIRNDPKSFIIENINN